MTTANASRSQLSGLICICISLPVLCTGCGTRTSTSPTWPEAIAYVVEGHNAEYDIWLADPDGSARIQLTRNSHMNGPPVWAPDGTRIAFLSNRGGYFSDVYVMQADGSGQTNLTRKPEIDHGKPHWSPDGTRLVFTITDIGVTGLYLIDVNDPEVRHLTTPGMAPSWSPDGTRIAFHADTGEAGGMEIYVMQADGSGVINLTRDPALDTEPTWSPDGTRIAFESAYRDGKNDTDIFVMNPDGSGTTRLTQDSLDDREPVWSPDGTRIAFVRGDEFGDSSDVWVMNADGTDQRRAAPDAMDSSWSPDGRRLAFSLQVDERTTEVWVVDLESEILTQIAASFTSAPAWRPTQSPTP